MTGKKIKAFQNQVIVKTKGIQDQIQSKQIFFRLNNSHLQLESKQTR